MSREIQFYVTALLLLLSIECRSQSFCTTDLDCNKPLKYVKCSICVKGQCEIINTNIFNPNSNCAYSRHHCNEGYCTSKTSKGVMSFEGYASCVCICSGVPFYGKKCEHVLPNGAPPFPTGAYSIMPPYVKLNQMSFILVFANGGPKPYIVSSDDIGGYYSRSQVEPIVSHKWDHTACVKLFSSDKFLHAILDFCDLINFKYCDTVFIIPFVIPFDLVTTWGETVKSFTRLMGIRVYRHRPLMLGLSSNLLYATSYPKKEKFETTPIVRFTNCGPTISKNKRYFLKDEIHLQAKIFYASSKSFSLVKKTDLSNAQDLRFEWYSVQYGYRRVGYLYWNILPFTLVGTNVINLTVSGYFQPWKLRKSEEKRDVNFNICLLTATVEPLVAVISGGSARFAFREVGLTLDASKSVNPNSPDTSAGMTFTFKCNWTEEAVCAPYSMKSKPFRPYVIKPNVLTSGRMYIFTLATELTNKDYFIVRGHTVQGAVANQTVVVGLKPKYKPYIEELQIDCIYNCEPKTNIQDIVCLRIKGPWTRLVKFSFEWARIEYNEEGSTKKEISVSDIRQSDTPSFILILNENTLKENTMYEFKATLVDTIQFAMFPIITTSVGKPKCTIQPERGIVGLTTFEVSCSTEEDSRLLEYYDTDQTDPTEFSGRMVTSQDPGNVEHFQLTRGNLVILSFDEVGMKITTVLTVSLSKNNLTSVNVASKLSDLETYSAVQDIGGTLQTVSVLADLMAHLINANDTYAVTVMENVIKFLSTLSIKRYSHAKQGISTLHIALSAARQFLSLDAAWCAARTLHTLTKAIAVGLKKDYHCTFNLLYQIYSCILDCIYVIIETEEKHTQRVSVPLQYMNPVFYTKVREITKHVLKTSFLLRSVLSYRHLPAQKHKLIEAKLGNLSIWIKVDTPPNLSNFTQQEYRNNKFPVIIPSRLAADVMKMDFYLALTFIIFKQNPTYVTKKTNTKNTIDPSVCFKKSSGHSCQVPRILKNGLQVAFDVTNFTSFRKFANITLEKLDHKLQDDWLDLVLPVYKIDPSPSADVVALFKLYSPETELIVLVERNMRPTYASLIRANQKITTTNLTVPIVIDASNQPQIYYIGIQPGAPSGVNKTVSVGFKVLSKACLIWHDRWKTGGCHSEIDQITNEFICECNKLSLIGGFVQDETLSDATVASFPLFLTANGNESMKCFCFLLLIFCIILLALCCLRADRHDRSRRFVNILPDNFPGDRYGYLVRVFTGARIGSGTDAAVGIKIYGTTNDGRSHILSSKTQEVMVGIGEDWFLIFEPETLGTLTYIDLWHDNQGADPAWFCDSITIWDLHHMNCYVFVVDDWINFSSNRFPQIALAPTPFSEIVSPSRVFLEYLMSGFLLSHIWFNVIARHPRDAVSRLDRLAMISCFIVVSMAFSLILINLTGNNGGVDDYSFSLTWSMVELGFYSCIVSGVVVGLLMHLFRRIYTIIFYIEHRSNIKTQDIKYTRLSVHGDYLTSSSVTSLNDERPYIHYGRRHHDHQGHHDYRGQLRKETFAERVNLNLIPKPLVPVQLEGDEPNVNIEKNWLLASWITVAAIFIICVVTSLFLSFLLPPITTLKWLAIVGLSVFIHAIILLPLKITCLSALLAVGFKRIIYKDIYTFDPKNGRQVEFFGDTKYLAQLIFRRMHPVYQPLHEVFHEKHRRKMHRSAMWRKMYDLLVKVMLLVVISKILQSQIRYNNDHHLKTVIKAFTPECNATDLRDLQNRLEPDVFKYLWYNWKILSQGQELSFFRKDWLGDYNNRMIGKVQLRQFRVEPGHCKAWRKLKTDCAAPFTTSSVDTNNYLPFWIKQNTSEKEEESPDQQYSDGWRFHWPNKDSNFFYTGITGHKYPSGGYIWDLGASRDEMDAALDDLWEQGWVGHYTRAVLAHVKVYNVNTRTFSEVVLLAEQTIAGQFLPLTVVQSLEMDECFHLWQIIFTFFTFMLLVRVVILTNWVGVIGLFKNWRHLYEILMAVNAFAVLYYLLVHLVTAPQYVTDYLIHVHDLKFFDFYKVTRFAFTSKTLLCALYILNVIRFFSLWRFGQALFRILYTIKKSMKYIIWVFSMFILFQYILFRPVSFLLQMFIEVRFSSNMIQKHNYLSLAATNSTNGINVFSFIVGFTNDSIMILLVLIFIQQQTATRYDLAAHWYIDNFFSFLVEEFTTALKTPTIRRTSLKLIQTMAAKYGAKKRMTRF